MVAPLKTPVEQLSLADDSRVLVTGATGRIGRHLVSTLVNTCPQWRVAALTRGPDYAARLWRRADVDVMSGSLTEPAALSAALDGVDLVFHLASYTPTRDEPNPDESAAHWSVTAEGTRNLMDAAIAAHVKRVVFFSSVKAMGEVAGTDGRPADELSREAPQCLYGRAKLAAERTVLQAGMGQGMAVSVLRLPMVYGLRGDDSLLRMVDAVARRRFPPWPRTENRRSAVHVDDVVRAAILVASDGRAAGETYLVTDGLPYSTRWLYEQICMGLGREVPKWTVPMWVLRIVASLGSVGERLTDRPMPLTSKTLSKLVDDAWFSSEKIRDDLCFVPERRIDRELPKLVRGYLEIPPGS
jgi:nucleoside-diphosphate-sugar epimerase